MHVSNLLSAVKALENFSSGKGTVSPFCTWVGDAELFISKGLDVAQITDKTGHIMPDVSASQAEKAVLLLVALRANPHLKQDPRPVEDHTE